MSETSSPAVPPQTVTGRRTWKERALFMQRFSLVLMVLMGLSFLSLIPVYIELRSGPVLLDMGITILAVIGLYYAHMIARQQKLMESGYTVLVVAVLMIAGMFVEQGDLLLSGPPILIGVLLTIITIWPGQLGRWLVVAAFYGLLLLATQWITLPFSYNLAQTESFNTRNNVIIIGALSVVILAFVRSLQQGSIRVRLIISYISLALLPVMAVGLIISFINVQRAQTQIFAQLDATASQKENEILTWVEQLQRTLAISLTNRDANTVGQILQGTDNDAASVAQIEQTLQNVTVQTGLFEEIFVLDLQGQVVISTDATQVGKIQINQLYFREGVNAPFFQPPLFTPSLGTVSMVVSRPLYNSQQNQIGVIAGRVDLEQLTQITSQFMGLGENSELYLVGLNNGVITRPRLAETEGAIFARSDGAVAAVNRREQGQGIYENYQGVQVVGVYKWMPAVQMALLAEQELDEAFAPIRSAVLTSVIAIVVTVFLALLVALYMARTIATPVVQLAGAAQVVAGGNLAERVELERDDEIGLLASAFNSMTEQLQRLIGGLEERVAEQTRDLTLAAEVGQRISTERNLDSLLTAAAQLIKDRFDLYHAQIYLTNSTEQLLILRASTGEAGRELLRRGHRLTVGPGSINGAAAANRQPVIVANTQQDPTFRPNPLLPDTRSEMAVPLLAGNRVVGVLDLQSTQAEALSEANLSAFQTLAGQLAVAIENASLFTEVETARTTLEEQGRRLTRTSWDSYLDAITRQERVVATYQTETPTISPAGETVPHLVVPVQLAGEPIGFVELISQSAQEWQSDKLAIIQEVANQVAQQVENLRLFAQTEQYRFQAEQAVRRLTREGWETYQATAPNAAAGYIYTQDQILPLPATPTDNGTNGTYIHPLTLRGEPIGAFHLPDTHALGDSTIQIIDAIAETLIDHIENLRLTTATQTALAQTETLYNLTSQLTQSETLANVAQIIAGLYENSSITLLTIESDALGQPEWLTIAASWSPTPSLIEPGTRFPLAAFPISALWIKSGGKPVLIENIESDPRVDAQTRAISQQFGIMASAYLPLRIGQNWVGLITISWDKPKMFSDGEIQLMESVSAQAAVVVNNRLLLQSTTKRANRETLINTINRRIQSATSVETALETAAREISQLLKARQTLVEINPLTQPES